MASRFLFLFFLLVFPFAIVHDTTNRWLRSARHLNQVQARFTGATLGFVKLYDTDLLVMVVDQTDGRDADLVIDTQLFAYFALLRIKTSSDGRNLSNEDHKTLSTPASTVRRRLLEHKVQQLLHPPGRPSGSNGCWQEGPYTGNLVDNWTTRRSRQIGHSYTILSTDYLPCVRNARSNIKKTIGHVDTCGSTRIFAAAAPPMVIVGCASGRTVTESALGLRCSMTKATPGAKPARSTNCKNPRS